jgi:hypothetical protein
MSDILKDEYLLGILWSIGTYNKAKKIFTIQTSAEDKLWYLEYVRSRCCPNKEVRKTTRTLRGKTKEVYILSFKYPALTDKLLSMGYGLSVFPEEISKEFMTAILELSIVKETRISNYEYYLIFSNSIAFLETIQNFFYEEYEIPYKEFINKGKGAMAICYTKKEFCIIAGHHLHMKDINVDRWKSWF